MTDTIPVLHRSGSYHIHIGRQIITQTFQFFENLVQPNGRVVVLLDSNLHDDIIATLSKNLEENNLLPIIIPTPGGENAKTFTTFAAVSEVILSQNITRTTPLITIGGGTIGDLGGFVAASLLRGIPLIHIPSTLLAMVDSTIGGKTAINSRHGKNLIGAFYQPVSVIIDVDLLTTLLPRHYIAACAEIIKYGIISQAEFFDFLEQYTKEILARDPKTLRHLILQSIHAKKHFVEQDETEENIRVLLNLGHTFGHALETMFAENQQLIHGEAIAIGIVLACRFAKNIGVIHPQTTQRIQRLLKNVGLPTSMPAETNFDTMVQFMQRDKKNLHGTISLVLPHDIGVASVHHNIPPDEILSFLKEQHA